MGFETVPPLTAAESIAIRRALAQAGVDVEERPAGYTSAWRRAAAAEAVEDEDAPAAASSMQAPPPSAGYTPSPRSTRGATRA